MPILFDFKCNECDQGFEDYISSTTVAVVCPHCTSTNVEKVLSAVRVGLYNNRETRTEALKRRSEEHTAREQRKGNMPSVRDLAGAKSTRDLK